MNTKTNSIKLKPTPSFLLVFFLISPLLGGATKRSVGFGVVLNGNYEIVLAGERGLDLGFRKGDKFVEFEGKPLDDCAEMMRKVFRWPGSTFKIGLVRDGAKQTMSVKPESRWSDRTNDDVHEAIVKKLSCGDQVRLLLIVGEIQNAFPNIDENWHKARRAYVEADFSRILVGSFSSFPEFSLLERKDIEPILQELHFQNTGAVSTSTVQQIGKMLGASHAVIVESSRFPNGGNDFVDVNTERLVEIESGKILATSLNKVNSKGKFLR